MSYLVTTLIAALVAGVVSALVQVGGMQRQTSRTLDGQNRERKLGAEAMRLDRLERGVAELRTAALMLAYEAEIVASRRPPATQRGALDALAPFRDLLSSMVHATTAINVNGDQSLVDASNEILGIAERIGAGLSPGRSGASAADVSALNDGVLSLTRLLRSQRGYGALADILNHRALPT